MQDLNDLALFARVVEHQGFAPAGRALGLPKSTVSRRIAQLEATLGVRLIQRSTRRFSVTEVGERLLAHARAILLEARAAQEAVAEATGQPRGVVRLSCPIALLHAAVAPMLVEFMQRQPHVEIHLTATNRRVDVVAEGFDLALRARTPPLEDSSLVLRELAQREEWLVASPRLFRAHPKPKRPSDLAALPSLGAGPAGRQHVWQLIGPQGAREDIGHHPRMVTDDLQTLLAAAQAGLGVAQLPDMVVAGALAAGRLERVLPGWCTRGAIVHAVLPSRRGMLPSVRALLDFLAERFAALSPA